MQWKELTSEGFRDAVRVCDGVCVVPMGCLERHGPHLPLGTDQIAADAIAAEASRREPCIVFPSYYVAQIAEARHVPGAFSLPNELVLTVLLATLDEIARNGLTRIVLANFHGGNNALLDLLMFTLVQQPREYVVYRNPGGMTDEQSAKWREMLEADQGGHAGELETSLMLHLAPDTVELDRLAAPIDWTARGKQKHLKGARNPMWWYADYPTHFAGDPTHAKAAKGEFLLDCAAENLAAFVKTVKADDVTPELQRRYLDAAADPLNAPWPPKDEAKS
jgi:creatinine amidohydrolase